MLVGDIVVLRAADREPQLGQVLEQGSAAAPDDVGGSGLLIGVIGEDGALRRTLGGPFASASLEPASEAHLAALQRASQAYLSIGTWRSCGVSVDARLRAQGFGRHTFLCGQSGSGKTYALGVILEQLLLGTDLRMVVLDPNADFVRLGQARPEAPADAADRLAKTEVRVLGADASGARPVADAVRDDASTGAGRGAAARPARRPR